MRPFLILTLCSGLLLVAGRLHAQSRRGLSAAEQQAIEVRTSGAYRYGEGVGASRDAAREAARHDLVTRLRALIVSDQRLELSETAAGITKEYRTSTRLLSAMRLEGLDYLELPASGDLYRCLALVREEDFQAGMARQRAQIRAWVSEALAAAEQARLDDALRLSYWAYLLTHTVDSVAVDWPGVRLTEAGPALLEGIGQVVRQVRFEAAPAIRDEEGIGIPLRVTYHGQPATVDLSLYTSAGMAFPRVTNGLGYLELHMDPATLTSARQELELRLSYAYEGRMRHFPEIEALYEVFREQPLDTWVKVEVAFPLTETEAPPALPVDPPVAAAGLRTNWPLSILILADQPGTPALLEGLQAYARQRRLQYYRQRPPPGRGELYVAVATEEQVLGVFLVDSQGYLDVRRQRRLVSLAQPELVGARQIWIVPQPP